MLVTVRKLVATEKKNFISRSASNYCSQRDLGQKFSQVVETVIMMHAIEMFRRRIEILEVVKAGTDEVERLARQLIAYCTCGVRHLRRKNLRRLPVGQRLQLPPQTATPAQQIMLSQVQVIPTEVRRILARRKSRFF